MFLELHWRNPPVIFHKIYIVPELKGQGVRWQHITWKKSLFYCKYDSVLKIDFSKLLKNQQFYQF